LTVRAAPDISITAKANKPVLPWRCSKRQEIASQPHGQKQPTALKNANRDQHHAQ